MVSTNNGAAGHADPDKIRARVCKAGTLVDRAIPPNQAPRDREQKRLPGSTLSRSVPACLTYRALARRTRPLLWSHALLRKGPLPAGKGP
jgi:hypothetical protein